MNTELKMDRLAPYKDGVRWGMFVESDISKIEEIEKKIESNNKLAIYYKNMKKAYKKVHDTTKDEDVKTVLGIQIESTQNMITNLEKQNSKIEKFLNYLTFNDNIDELFELTSLLLDIYT